MDTLNQELFRGLQDGTHFLRVLIRLTMAIFVGGLIGLEREYDGKQAGLRTHMLVALGAALFTLVPLEGGMLVNDLSRVIQGVATGIGFLGAGTILKLSDQHQIRGLNSAATIWLTAATGMAVGAGWIWPAVLAVVLAVLILFLIHPLQRWLRGKPNPHAIE
jgi:putative Mg2+ transporter-C (MgtC) family protein